MTNGSNRTKPPPRYTTPATVDSPFMATKLRPECNAGVFFRLCQPSAAASRVHRILRALPAPQHTAHELQVYGSADMATVMADMEDEAFVPISVGGNRLPAAPIAEPSR